MSIDEREDALVERIRPLLAGHPPEVQGAALADLVAIFIAGHISVDRDTTLMVQSVLIEAHQQLVTELVGLYMARRDRVH